MKYRGKTEYDGIPRVEYHGKTVDRCHCDVRHARGARRCKFFQNEVSGKVCLSLSWRCAPGPGAAQMQILSEFNVR
eukprot:2913890-Karenia_brevis.AAC.1